MHDLAEWHRAQAASLPMPPELLQATQSAVDALSDEALRICDAMSSLEAATIADLKHKAYALEYLLPEEADTHVALCRSMCSDIRRL